LNRKFASVSYVVGRIEWSDNVSYSMAPNIRSSVIIRDCIR